MNINVGKNIRNIRKSKKMTLKELGSKVKLSEQAIGQYERGDRNPSIETLKEIANALNVSIDYLINENNFNSVPRVNRLIPRDITEFGQRKLSINEFLNMLSPYVDFSKFQFDEDPNEHLSSDFLENVCKYLELEEEHEAYLYSLFLYKTDNELFKIISFYEYLQNKYSIDLCNLNDLFSTIGEFFNNSYGFDVNLTYVCTVSAKRKVEDIKKNTENYRKILESITLLNDSYTFAIDSLNTEQIYNIFNKLDEMLEVELYKIHKNDKSIDAKFYF